MDNKNVNKNISNTMEINSILEEARRNRAQNFKDVSQDTVVFPEKTAKATKKTDDDFVIYDEKDVKSTNKSSKKKSKKKPIIITVVVLVLVLAVAVGGFLFFNKAGDFKYADNIVINGVKIGGMTENEAYSALKAQESQLAQSIKITVKAEDQNVVLTKDDFKYTFTTDDVLAQAKKYTEDTLVPTGEQTYTIAMELDKKSCILAAEKVAKELDRPAQNAMVTKFDSSKKGNEKFVIEEGKSGVVIKQTELVTKLHDFVNSGQFSGEIQAQFEDSKPKYTKDYLLANIKKLSSFTTTSTNTSNGNTNMKLSLKACNNSIINPGETWSFNKCTGDSNQTSLGYKPAGVLVQGRSETGIGGGICQSSTTIYNATMLCGMEVVERACHYYPSTYVDPGRDATIDYGNIDLKVKNIFDYQLFMECYMDGVVLHCNMYGIPNPEFDEIKITSSSSGNRAQASRTYYLDGKKVKTEKLPSSTYSSGGGGGSSSSGSQSNNDTPKPTQKPTQAPTSTETTPTQAPSSGDSGSQPSTDGGGTGGEPSTDGGGTGSDPGTDGGGSGTDSGTSGGDAGAVAQTPASQEP